MAQAEIITGADRRRNWSEDQKREILAAAFAPGACVKAVARQVDIGTGQIYRWRRERQGMASAFAQVVVAPTGALPAAALDDRAVDIVLDKGARIRIPASVPPNLAAAIVNALVRR